MFVLGLLVGPAVGVLAWDILSHQVHLDARLTLGVVVLVCLLLVFVLPLQLELRLGLVTGLCLGVLLAATPLLSRSGEFQ